MVAMKARRILILVLASAMQLLAWRDAVPVCASMTHCAGMSEVRSHCDGAATISGRADCCKGGSVEARSAVSPMPQRAQSAAPIVVTAALGIAPPETTFVARGRATADTSKPLPPLLGSCILRI